MLVVLLISLALALLQASSVNNLLPAIGSAMPASEAGLQMILSGFALAVGITLVPAGRLGDIFGRSGLWAIGLAVFILASLGAGLSDTILVLNIMRLVQGLGVGLLTPQVTGLVQQHFEGASRAWAFGMMAVVITAATAVGPLMSGAFVAWLGQDPGWRYSFFINVPLGIIGLLAAWKVLPFKTGGAGTGAGNDGAGKRKVDLDPIGMLLLTVAVLGMMLPFMLHGVAWRWFLLAGGFAMVGVWVAWERAYAGRGREPMVDMAMFKIRSFSYATAISGLQFLGSFTIFVVLALFLQGGLGQTALLVGIIGVPNAIAASLGAVWAGQRALESGKAIQVFALSLMVGAVLVLAAGFWAVATWGWSPYWLVLPVLPIGLGTGLMRPSNQTQAMMEIPAAHGGTASGLQQMTQRIATAIGNAVTTGVLFSTYQGGRTTQGWLLGAGAGLGVIALSLNAALVVAVIFWMRVPTQPTA